MAKYILTKIAAEDEEDNRIKKLEEKIEALERKLFTNDALITALLSCMTTNAYHPKPPCGTGFWHGYNQFRNKSCQ